MSSLLKYDSSHQASSSESLRTKSRKTVALKFNGDTEVRLFKILILILVAFVINSTHIYTCLSQGGNKYKCNVEI
jgi:hypothetical protein